ncbi:interleukin-20 isoform X2 [Perognathus longimembris pacificus]|uniref:interleukin-20 isoform X2 n=1 Tax=Perognathus longimembris pacificus TaxID=214514 RepID=UPI002018A54B|nr:interleukin-20 isoform X2 [Perognathus longimembris pacificus]
MKGTGLVFGLISAVLSVLGRPSNGLKTLHLGSCVITTNLQEIQNGFSQIRDSVPSEKCCLLHHLLSLYLGRVFKNYQTSDHHTLRMISSLANSFLIIKKDLRICHAHGTCQCEEEATEKYSRILSHLEELEPRAAIVKALGELDILLRWMEESE